MEQRSPVKQEQQENVHLPLAPIVTGDLQANPECSTPSDLPGHPEEVNEEQKGEGIAAGESGEERSAEQQAIGPATAPEVTSVPPPLRLVTLSFAVAAGLVSVSVMASAPPAALPICAAEGTSAEAAAPKEAAAEAAGAEPSPPEGLTAGEAEGAGAEALQPPPPPLSSEEADASGGASEEAAASGGAPSPGPSPGGGAEGLGARAVVPTVATESVTEVLKKARTHLQSHILLGDLFEQVRTHPAPTPLPLTLPTYPTPPHPRSGIGR